MSLTDQSLTLWHHPKVPVAALAAQHAARMTLHRIDEPHRALFEDALGKLVGWWAVRRKVKLIDLWNAAQPEAARVAAELTGNAKKAADLCLRALTLQASNLERAGRGRRELPPECYAIEETDFEALLRDAAKIHGHTQVGDLSRRLAVLEQQANDAQWPELVEVAGRMGWTKLERGLAKLPARLRDLAEAVDVGGVVETTDVGGRPALRVTTVGGERRVGVLSEEELEELRAVVPWIAS